MIEDAVILIVVQDENGLGPDFGIGGDGVNFAGHECRAGGGI